MINYLGTKIEKTRYSANGYGFTTYSQRVEREQVYWTTSGGLSTSSKYQADLWRQQGLPVYEHRERF